MVCLWRLQMEILWTQTPQSSLGFSVWLVVSFSLQTKIIDEKVVETEHQKKHNFPIFPVKPKLSFWCVRKGSSSDRMLELNSGLLNLHISSAQNILPINDLIGISLFCVFILGGMHQYLENKPQWVDSTCMKIFLLRPLQYHLLFTLSSAIYCYCSHQEMVKPDRDNWGNSVVQLIIQRFFSLVLFQLTNFYFAGCLFMTGSWS